MAALSLGLGALGLAGKLYGGIKSAQANKQAHAQLYNQMQENEAFYNNRVNRDFSETNAAKGVIEQLRKRYQQQAQTIDSKTAATGGTAEANIAAKTAANQQHNDAMNQVAQQGTGYQLAAEGQYRNTNSALQQQKMALNQQKAHNATNLMGSGGELLGTAAKVYGLGNENKNPIIPERNNLALNTIAKSGTAAILNTQPELNADYRTPLHDFSDAFG